MKLVSTFRMVQAVDHGGFSYCNTISVSFVSYSELAKKVFGLNNNLVLKNFGYEKKIRSEIKFFFGGGEIWDKKIGTKIILGQKNLGQKIRTKNYFGHEKGFWIKKFF